MQTGLRLKHWLSTACAALMLWGCAGMGPGARTQLAASDDELLIVAVNDSVEAQASTGSTPRASYANSTGYAGSTGAEAVAAALAREMGLQEQAFWSIAPLKLRCMLYRIQKGQDRAAVMARLAADPRVQLVQPQNQFETLASSNATAAPVAYDDPYVGLQRGFISIQAAAAQRYSQGDGVRVALIDSGVDAAHPDLQGRLAGQRNFVGAEHPLPSAGERHGTEMAGVIAAVANNRTGIVGVAPRAQLLALRACWQGSSGSAQCNSFTLAQALGVAIAERSDIINLSLTGPADPLLQRLTEYAMAQGAVVVGAAPPQAGSGVTTHSFPSHVKGVLTVASSDEQNAAAPTLSAPGRDILTLSPGGGYGYATGSSLAAAHVSGAVALLRVLRPGLNGAMAQAWLLPPAGAAPATPIDLCRAVRQARPAAECGGAQTLRAASATP